MTLLEETIGLIQPPDSRAMAAARARQEKLTKPRGSLGRLEELSVRLAGIQRKAQPKIKRKAVIVMAADHGVVAEGVSLYPQEVTVQMVRNFLKGDAAINVIARQVGAKIIVADMGMASALDDEDIVPVRLGKGTANMAQGPAMTLETAIAALEAGINIVEHEYKMGLDVVATGDMGIGNTTASSAICSVMTGHPVEIVTGAGAGVAGRQLEHKVAVIKRALSVNQPEAARPLEVLAKVGGFEIAGLAGVTLGAAARRIPVVIDGFISGSAALIAAALVPQVRDYLIAGHLSAEPGHKCLLDFLGLKPLLEMEMRLGEGTGAALGLFLCETAARLLNEMKTFTEAGVSDKVV